MRICEANFGSPVPVRRRVRCAAAAMLGVPPAFAEFWRRGPYRPGPGTALGRIVETQADRPYCRRQRGAAFLERDPCSWRPSSLDGFRTLLIVPMLQGERAGRRFAIYRQEVRPFTDKQIELVDELRRPGRHRHREHSAAQRAARIAAAADRHRRRAQGDQPLDLRSASRARHAGRSRPRGCARPTMAVISAQKGEVYRMRQLTASRPNSMDIMSKRPIQPGRGPSPGAPCSKATVVHVPDVLAIRNISDGRCDRDRRAFAPCSASRCCAKAIRSASSC